MVGVFGLVSASKGVPEEDGALCETYIVTLVLNVDVFGIIIEKFGVLIILLEGLFAFGLDFGVVDNDSLYSVFAGVDVRLEVFCVDHDRGCVILI